MANIVELIIRGSDQSGGAIRSSVRNLEGLDSAVSSIGRRLSALVSVGAMVSLAKSALDLGSSLSDMSERFGVSASDLSALALPAKMVGVELEGVGNAFKFMQKNIAEASNPISDQAIALKLLGVSLDDLKGKASMEQFFLLADAFNKLEDDENRAAIAMAIFGRAWDAIIPLIKKGSADIAKAMREAREEGAALTEEEVKNLDAYGDAVDKVLAKTKIAAGRGIMEIGEFYKWMTRQNKESVSAVEKLSAAYEALLIKAGLASGRSVVSGKIASIIVPNPEPPPKEKAGSLEEEKAAIAKKKKADEDAKKERERLDKEYAQLHAKNLAEEGRAVHDALASEMGMDQEYVDIRAKIRMDEFKDWQKQEEERAKVEEKYYTDQIDQLQGLQDAQRAEFEITEKIGEYRAEDAFNAAMYWGNAEQALTLLNEGLYEQFRIMDEGRNKVSALSNLYATVFRGKDGVIADMANVAVDAFHGMTEALVEFVMTGKERFRDFANSVIADIMRIAVRQAIVQPIAQGLMGAFGIATPVAARAGGGPVFGGSTYLVGERGPELFMPSSSGSIIPGGSGNVTVNVHNNTGSQVAVRKSASFDAQGMVIDMVLDGINRDVHGIRGVLGGV